MQGRSFDNNTKAFLALVRAGLWEKDVELQKYGTMDFTEILRLAEVQSVVGLIAAGWEHVEDVKIPKQEVLQFVASALRLEQRNIAMNHFIAVILQELNTRNIRSLLVKGQGIAQCYERPLWRSSGDVDLLFDHDNYYKAKFFLLSLASKIDEEDSNRLHLGITIDSWLVELHGTLHGGLSKKIDAELDEIQNDSFNNDNKRKWSNGDTTVLLPAPDNDVLIVFTHILQHFYGGGIGLRQICDWCRLIYKYKDVIDERLLERRLHNMGLMNEWKAFASLAVNYLNMPGALMLFYSEDNKWNKKANGILNLILESGNFGQGFDKSYKKNYPKALVYLMSFWLYTKYGYLQFRVFPLPAIKSWIKTILSGAKSKINKK